MRKRLVFNIVVPVVIVMTLGFFVLTLVSTRVALTSLERIRIDQTEVSLTSIEMQIDSVIHSTEQTMETWTLLSQLRQPLLEPDNRDAALRVSQALQVIGLNFSEFDALLIRNTKGEVVAAEDSLYFSSEYLSNLEYLEAARSGEPGISPVERSLTSGTPVFAIAIPLKSGQSVIGTFEVAYKLGYITRNLMDHITVGNNGYAIALNDNGQYISNPDFQKTLRDPADLGQLSISDLSQASGMVQYTSSVEGKRILTYRRHQSTGWILGMNGARSDVFGDLYRLVAINIAIAITATLAAMFISYAVIRKRIESLKRVSSLMEEFAGAGGDLTMRIAVEREDEIGELVTHFNRFVDQQEEIIHAVKRTSVRSRGAGERIHSYIQDANDSTRAISQNSSDINVEIQTLAKSQHQVGSAISDITTSMSVLNGEIADQTNATETSAQGVKDMMQSLQSISTILEDNTAIVERLHQDAQDGGNRQLRAQEEMDGVITLSSEIRGVTKLIKSIASQTNLLAMNAAIEAAHAGDSGRGFAVVADEIRKLAEQSGRNSGEIDKLLKNVVDQIEEANRGVSSNGETFRQIHSDIDAVHRSFQELSASVREISKSGEEMTAAMEALRSSAVSVNESVEQAAGRVQQIGREATASRELATRLETQINSIDQDSSLIHQKMESFSDLYHQLHDHIEQLAALVQRFTTAGKHEELRSVPNAEPLSFDTKA